MIRKPLALALILAALPAAAMAQHCGSLTLDVCPTPYDQTLPAAKDMLSWDQTSRVIGFRNDYRNYAGDVFRHGASTPLERAEKQLTDARYTLKRPHLEFAGLPEARERQRYAGAERW